MLEICIQSSKWYDENDPVGSIKMISECGFEAIDYNMDTQLSIKAIKNGERSDFFDKSIDEIIEYYAPLKQACEKYNVKVAQMHAPFPLYVLNNEELNDYLIMSVEKSCAVCKYLGCENIVVHPFSHPDKDTEWEINIDMYKKMIPFAKKYGVKLCLENMFRSFNGHLFEGACSTSDDTIRFIDTLNEEAGEELFGYCFDIGHANILGRDLFKYIKDLGNNRLLVTHIHDNPGTMDTHLIPYTQTRSGSCYTDWESMIKGLRDIGYTGTISFETFMGVDAFPKEVRPEVLKLISAIGRYFRKRITE